MLYKFRNLLICLGWMDSEVGMNKAMKRFFFKEEIKYHPKSIYFANYRVKKMQVVLGKKSRTEPEGSLYFFAPIICFNVTGWVGNQWQHLSGNRWGTAELFGTVCTGVCHGREGLYPSHEGQCSQKLLQPLPGLRARQGGDYASPSWLPCLSWLHPILFTAQIKISSIFLNSIFLNSVINWKGIKKDKEKIP